MTTLVQIWHKNKINIYTKPHDKKKDGFSWYIINKYKFDRQNCSKTQKKKYRQYMYKTRN